MESKQAYPEELIRGISSSDGQFVSPEGYATAAAFKFDDYQPELRQDGYCELSINWLDGEGAVEVLLNQHNPRKNRPQFQGGYCRLRRSTLDNDLRTYFDDGFLAYERRPIAADKELGLAENKYHGNLLLKNNSSKSLRTNIQSALATLAGKVIPRPGS